MKVNSTLEYLIIAPSLDYYFFENFPPLPQFYSKPPSLTINFVIPKSLFQNFVSISIKTYVLQKIKILIE